MCLSTFFHCLSTLTVIPVSKNRNYFCLYGLRALFDLASVLYLPSPFQSLLKAIRFSIRSSWQFERDAMILKILQVWHSGGYGIHYFYGACTSYFFILTKLKIPSNNDLLLFHDGFLYCIYIIKNLPNHGFRMFTFNEFDHKPVLQPVFFTYTLRSMC